MGTRLVLPLPPSENHSHINVVLPPQYPKKKQRLARVPSQGTKDYKQLAGWKAIAWRRATRWEIPPRGRKVIMWYEVFWPDRRRRDPSNLPKVLQDALNGVLWSDDCTVLPRALDYSIDRGRPRIELDLEVMEEVDRANRTTSHR